MSRGNFYGAEIFFLYFFTLAPDCIAVFTLADPDVAEIIFGIRNYDNDFVCFRIDVNARRDLPEPLPDRAGIGRPAFFF